MPQASQCCWLTGRRKGIAYSTPHLNGPLRLALNANRRVQPSEGTVRHCAPLLFNTRCSWGQYLQLLPMGAKVMQHAALEPVSERNIVMLAMPFPHSAKKALVWRLNALVNAKKLQKKLPRF
jgi:hypothetical protein